MLVHVAVGVIRNSQGQILIAKRNEAAHQGGLWEFPGGKVESGESVQEALTRELHEELGIECPAAGMTALISIDHQYADKHVNLDVWWVDQFVGKPIGMEGQPLKWVAAADLAQYAFPKANDEIVQAIVSR